MINWIIKKLGGFTEKDKESAFTAGENSALERLKNVVVSERLDTCEKEGHKLDFMAGFIDYICVKVDIPKIYNNGCYEKFLEAGYSKK